jgi:hypothetical protein
VSRLYIIFREGEPPGVPSLYIFREGEPPGEPSLYHLLGGRTSWCAVFISSSGRANLLVSRLYIIFWEGEPPGEPSLRIF